MPISVELMGPYKLQPLMTGGTWVGLPAMKPHTFNAPANHKAETMEFLDEADRPMPRSDRNGKLVPISTWLLLTCSLLSFGQFIRKDPERHGDLLSFSPSFRIQPRRSQEGSKP